MRHAAYAVGSGNFLTLSVSDRQTLHGRYLYTPFVMMHILLCIFSTGSGEWGLVLCPPARASTPLLRPGTHDQKSILSGPEQIGPTERTRARQLATIATRPH